MSVRTARSARRSSRQSGFTLIELLVTLALLALVLALAAGGMRYARSTWQAAARLDQLSSVEMAETFLRARLAEAMPVYEQRRAGVMRVLFHGMRQSVSFVAPAPNGPVGAGLYRYTVEAASTAGPAGGPPHHSLVVSLVPHQDAPAAPVADPQPDSQPDRHELVRKIKSVTFRYFGRSEIKAPPAWHADWTRTDAMPNLVEIAVGRDEAEGGRIIMLVELRLQPRAR
jgi:general secretion pathway protein J